MAEQSKSTLGDTEGVAADKLGLAKRRGLCGALFILFGYIILMHVIPAWNQSLTGYWTGWNVSGFPPFFSSMTWAGLAASLCIFFVAFGLIALIDYTTTLFDRVGRWTEKMYELWHKVEIRFAKSFIVAYGLATLITGDWIADRLRVALDLADGLRGQIVQGTTFLDRTAERVSNWSINAGSQSEFLLVSMAAGIVLFLLSINGLYRLRRTLLNIKVRRLADPPKAKYLIMALSNRPSIPNNSKSMRLDSGHFGEFTANSLSERLHELAVLNKSFRLTVTTGSFDSETTKAHQFDNLVKAIAPVNLGKNERKEIATLFKSVTWLQNLRICFAAKDHLKKIYVILTDSSSKDFQDPEPASRTSASAETDQDSDDRVVSARNLYFKPWLSEILAAVRAPGASKIEIVAAQPIITDFTDYDQYRAAIDWSMKHIEAENPRLEDVCIDCTSAGVPFSIAATFYAAARKVKLTYVSTEDGSINPFDTGVELLDSQS